MTKAAIESTLFLSKLLLFIVKFRLLFLEQRAEFIVKLEVVMKVWVMINCSLM